MRLRLSFFLTTSFLASAMFVRPSAVFLSQQQVVVTLLGCGFPTFSQDTSGVISLYTSPQCSPTSATTDTLTLCSACPPTDFLSHTRFYLTFFSHNLQHADKRRYVTRAGVICILAEYRWCFLSLCVVLRCIRSSAILGTIFCR